MSDLTDSQTIRLEAARILGDKVKITDVREVLALAHAIEHGEAVDARYFKLKIQRENTE